MDPDELRQRRIELAHEWLNDDIDWSDIRNIAGRLGEAQEIIRSLLEELGEEQDR